MPALEPKETIGYMSAFRTSNHLPAQPFWSSRMRLDSVHSLLIIQNDFQEVPAASFGGLMEQRLFSCIPTIGSMGVVIYPMMVDNNCLPTASSAGKEAKLLTRRRHHLYATISWLSRIELSLRFSVVRPFRAQISLFLSSQPESRWCWHIYASQLV